MDGIAVKTGGTGARAYGTCGRIAAIASMTVAHGIVSRIEPIGAKISATAAKTAATGEKTGATGATDPVRREEARNPGPGFPAKNLIRRPVRPQQ